MKNKTIQGLRGIFALCVLLSHCYFLSDYGQSNLVFENGFRRLANVGFFFMVAGFFAYKSTREEGFFTYMKRKLLRIYPLHILLLIALVGKQLITGSFVPDTNNIISLVLTSLLLQSWVPNVTIVTLFNTVSWFLSSLLFCYIVLYWIKKFTKQNAKHLYIITAVLLLVKVIASLAIQDTDIGYYWLYLCPLAGLVDVLIGACLAVLTSKIKLSQMVVGTLQIVAIVLIVGTFMLKSITPQNITRGFLTILANAMLVFAFSVETKVSTAILGNKVMTFLGNISFEFYLSHVVIMSVITKLSFMKKISTDVSPFITLIVVIAACVVFSTIYKLIFEKLFEFIKKKVDKEKI